MYNNCAVYVATLKSRTPSTGGRATPVATAAKGTPGFALLPKERVLPVDRRPRAIPLEPAAPAGRAAERRGWLRAAGDKPIGRPSSDFAFLPKQRAREQTEAECTNHQEAIPPEPAAAGRAAERSGGLRLAVDKPSGRPSAEPHFVFLPKQRNWGAQSEAVPLELARRGEKGRAELAQGRQKCQTARDWGQYRAEWQEASKWGPRVGTRREEGEQQIGRSRIDGQASAIAGRDHGSSAGRSAHLDPGIL
jgi:hypothetical protein